MEPSELLSSRKMIPRAASLLTNRSSSSASAQAGGVGLLAVPARRSRRIVVLGAVFNTTSPCHCFMTSGNILTTAQEFSYVGIAALGGRWSS